MKMKPAIFSGASPKLSRTVSEQQYAKGRPEDHLVAILKWQEKVKKPLVDVGKLKTQIEETLGTDVFNELKAHASDEAALFKIESLLYDSKTLKNAIAELLTRVEHNAIRMKLKEATLKLKKAEEKGDEEEVKRAFRECNELRERLAKIE